MTEIMYLNGPKGVIRLQLYDWQEKDVEWLMRQNSLLCHDCGL